jgi:hypothetical protein
MNCDDDFMLNHQLAGVLVNGVDLITYMQALPLF